MIGARDDGRSRLNPENKPQGKIIPLLVILLEYIKPTFLSNDYVSAFHFSYHAPPCHPFNMAVISHVASVPKKFDVKVF